MALSILDGNQSATTLSTILSSGQHITAHTVVSLGTQAITDMRGAVSGSVVSISNFPSTQTIAGTVTANAGQVVVDQGGDPVDSDNPFPIYGTVTANNVIFNDDSGFQSVVQAISDIEKNTIRSSLWIADSSGSNGFASDGQILSQNYPMPISGTVTANLSISATAITSGSFASLTSATLVPGNTARKMATVYNLGAGQLFVNAGATATTLGGGFMVALSSGDFYECDYTTTTLSAIFATAGTASWVSH